MEGMAVAQYQDNGKSVHDALKQYKEGLGIFEQKMPMMGRKFNEFTEQCFLADSLTEKEKQLIALGISISAQDEFCMIYHTKGCLDQGATEENILEVISVAAAFGGGAALSQGVTLVQQCIQEFGHTTH
ncbi:carboxymuconolactone decarboxylase family protein [Bacillus velezensis]|uniref:carboxymuconolactone decarboxylase family protein n=2 Tax=Bacillaceae TaxID=186817 RepID=UPI0013EECD9F|nr:MULTISPECIES: carboxymuconolactone decarboxylase family protein [Bacillus]KAF6603197.1 carboxymuconolactone decarboxylase family protein [Bacillus sp. EKM420B]KAF6607752.1 carboxymuconolactone decarboxylase family protein [Bacillus sp. EKM417B]MEC3659149.1 carboxymuconolactone decarboxylase family protein [Bacillus velezensis]MEC3685387.1 carboxymuconolactone decarboxylase family protein [Bacillus velezensis]MEC3788337.1 carboxymuconolactone decarboxylase family protein [Bacillus velezensis